MAQTKKMNEVTFAEILKDFNVVGELVRARQEEKQALLDEFDSQCKRFFFGRISEKSLASSVKKTNKELKRLDNEIRRNIERGKKLSNRAHKLVSDQSPIVYIATLSGLTGGNMKKKSSKKTAKKSPAKKSAKKSGKKAKKKK